MSESVILAEFGADGGCHNNSTLDEILKGRECVKYEVLLEMFFDNVDIVSLTLGAHAPEGY